MKLNKRNIIDMKTTILSDMNFKKLLKLDRLIQINIKNIIKKIKGLLDKSV